MNGFSTKIPIFAALSFLRKTKYSVDMAGLRSFFLFYIILVFTLFNSNWAENSLQNIPHVPHVNNIHLLDVYEEADMNTHALPAASKIVKHSPVKRIQPEIFSFKSNPKIKLPDIAVSIICESNLFSISSSCIRFKLLNTNLF
jgi:hypothetical protein